MKKNSKRNWESNFMRTPLILGLSMALCIPATYSYAVASDMVENESVQSVLQGRTVKGKIIDENNESFNWRICRGKRCERHRNYH